MTYSQTTAVPLADTINIPLPGAEHFVIEIHANDGVGAEFPRAILQLGNRQVASPGEFFLIGRGAAAHKIADAGKSNP